MPLFVNVHNIDGPVSIEQAAAAHAADLQTQPEFGVIYLQYWVDVSHGKIFCPVDAPDADTAHTVHRKAHGSSQTRSNQYNKVPDRHQMPGRARSAHSAKPGLRTTVRRSMSGGRSARCVAGMTHSDDSFDDPA